MAAQAGDSAVAAQVKAQLDHAVKKHAERGPTYPLPKLRSSRTEFRKEVVTVCDGLRVELALPADSAGAPKAARRAAIERALPKVEVLLTLGDEAAAALATSVVAADNALLTQQIFTPVQKREGALVMENVTPFRTAVTDNVTAGDDESAGARTRCKVGTNINRSNPIEARDLAKSIVRAVRGPAADEVLSNADRQSATDQAAQTRKLLEGAFIDVEAFLPPIEASLLTLESELAVAQAKRNKALETRDLHQLELEQTNSAILVLLNGTAGIAARDALRKILPTTTHAQRINDRPNPPPQPPPETEQEDKSTQKAPPVETQAKPDPAKPEGAEKKEQTSPSTGGNPAGASTLTIEAEKAPDKASDKASDAPKPPPNTPKAPGKSTTPPKS